MHSEDNKHKHYEKSITKEYLLRALLFTIIASALAAAVMIAAFKPVCSVVHKAEAALSMTVRDLEISGNDEIVPIEKKYPCAKIAQLVCEDKGINVPVYYGSNRVSLGSGVGLSSKHSCFGNDDITVIGGYDEACFAALKLVKAGDTITVNTANSKIIYRISNVVYDSKSSPSFEREGNQLILYSMFSDFSEHADECFYAVAEKMSEEAVDNE